MGQYRPASAPSHLPSAGSQPPTSRPLVRRPSSLLACPMPSSSPYSLQGPSVFAGRVRVWCDSHLSARIGPRCLCGSAPATGVPLPKGLQHQVAKENPVSGEERNCGRKEKAFFPAFWTKGSTFSFCAEPCTLHGQPWVHILCLANSNSPEHISVFLVLLIAF